MPNSSLAESFSRFVAVEVLRDHRFSSTQANMPPDIAAAVLAMSAAIPDEDLGGDGRVEEIHCTVKYGTHEGALKDVRRALAGEGPITMKIGALSTFPPSESSDGAEVLKLDVESKDLARLNKVITAEVDNETTFPYDAHITVAYVKPGVAKKYVGKDHPLFGRVVEIDTLVFSDVDDERTDIKLIETHGDLPGHEFRGNQWTGGRGGGSSSVGNQWKDGFGNEDKERIPPGDPRRDANFKAWFGESKVVSEDGSPKVVFHGGETDENFNPFQSFVDVEDKGDHPDWLSQIGNWFTDGPATAAHFGDAEPDNSAGQSGKAIYPVFLKIENPYVRSTYGQLEADLEEFKDENAKDEGLEPSVQGFRLHLMKYGYDGIVISRSTTDTDEVRSDFVPFTPEQIKSATGNRGTFSPKDKRITHGDLPGHEFRGNQWTGGRGGGSSSVQKTSRYEGSPAKWDLSKVASREELQAAAKSARAYSERVSKVHGIRVAIHDPANYINSAHAAIIEAQMHAGIMGASKLARDLMKSEGWEVRVNTSDSNTNDGTTLAETDPEKKTLTLGFDAVMQAEVGPSGNKAPTWGPSAQTWIDNEPTLAWDKYGFPRVEQQILQHELGHVEVFALQRAAALKFVQDGDDKLLKTLDKTFHELSVALDDEAGATAYTERTRSDFTRWKTISSGARVELGGAAVQTFVPVFLNEAYAEMRAVVEANLWAHKETGLEEVDKYRPETLAVYAKIRSLLGEATKYLDKRPPSPKAKTYTDAAGPIRKSQVLGLPRSPTAKRGKHEPPTMGFVAPPQW